MRGAFAAGAALLLGGAAALLALLAAGAGELLLHGWLTAAVWLLGPTLGATLLLALHGLTGGAWGEALERPARAAALGSLLLVPALLPPLLGLAALYPWARPGALSDPLLAHRAPWLSQGPVLARAAVYLLVWLGGALLLAGPRARRGEGRAALVALLFVVTISLAAIDWIVPLEPRWHSSLLGLDLAVASGLGGLAALLLLLGGGRGLPTRVRHDLGNVLLALQGLHVYMAFSQFLVVWSGDQPREIGWYLTRVAGSWSLLARGVVLGLYVLPLACLVSRRVKRDPRLLGGVAALLLGGRLVESAWWVLPAAGPPSLGLAAGAAAAAAVLGGAWLLVVGLLERPAPRDAVAPVRGGVHA